MIESGNTTSKNIPKVENTTDKIKKAKLQLNALIGQQQQMSQERVEVN